MTKNNIKLLFASTLMLSATGCSMVGLDSEDSFTCKAANGVACSSVSGVYQNAAQKNLPAQKSSKFMEINGSVENIDKKVSSEDPELSDTAKKSVSEATRPDNYIASHNAKMPLYMEPKVVRVWFKSWEDSDAVLHDASYSYLALNHGKWSADYIPNLKRMGVSRLIPADPRKQEDAGAVNGGDKHLLEITPETVMPESASQPENQ